MIQTIVLLWCHTNHWLWHPNHLSGLFKVLTPYVSKARRAIWSISSRRVQFWEWFWLKVAANLNFFIITYEIVIFHMKLKCSKVPTKLQERPEVPPMSLFMDQTRWAIWCFVIRVSIRQVRVEKSIWLLHINHILSFFNHSYNFVSIVSLSNPLISALILRSKMNVAQAA